MATDAAAVAAGRRRPRAGLKKAELAALMKTSPPLAQSGAVAYLNEVLNSVNQVSKSLVFTGDTGGLGCILETVGIINQIYELVAAPGAELLHSTLTHLDKQTAPKAPTPASRQRVEVTDPAVAELDAMKLQWRGLQKSKLQAGDFERAKSIPELRGAVGGLLAQEKAYEEKEDLRNLPGLLKTLTTEKSKAVKAVEGHRKAVEGGEKEVAKFQKRVEELERSLRKELASLETAKEGLMAARQAFEAGTIETQALLQKHASVEIAVNQLTETKEALLSIVMKYRKPGVVPGAGAGVDADGDGDVHMEG